VVTTEPLVLFFGTLQAYEGLDLLLDAFGLVHVKRPDAQLHIAGAFSGDTDLNGLQRRSDALGASRYGRTRARLLSV